VAVKSCESVEPELPVADIVTSDRELFDAIDAGDRDRAIALWQLMIEESAAHMLRRLGPPRAVRPRPWRGKLRGAGGSQFLLTRDDAYATKA